MLSQTAEDCCTNMVPWVATAICVAESTRKFSFERILYMAQPGIELNRMKARSLCALAD